VKRAVSGWWTQGAGSAWGFFNSEIIRWQVKSRFTYKTATERCAPSLPNCIVFFLLQTKGVRLVIRTKPFESWQGERDPRSPVFGVGLAPLGLSRTVLECKKNRGGCWQALRDSQSEQAENSRRHHCAELLLTSIFLVTRKLQITSSALKSLLVFPMVFSGSYCSPPGQVLPAPFTL
jgi:hypothetical protein